MINPSAIEPKIRLGRILFCSCSVVVVFLSHWGSIYSLFNFFFTVSTILIFEIRCQANSEERITSILQVFTGLICKDIRLLWGTLLKLYFQIDIFFQRAWVFISRIFAAFFHQSNIWNNVKLVDVTVITNHILVTVKVERKEYILFINSMSKFLGLESVLKQVQFYFWSCCAECLWPS